MRNFKIWYILVFCFVCIGCESELDIEPEQEILTEQALDSEADILSLLVGTYAESKEQPTFGGRSQIISDLLGNTGQLDIEPSTFPWLVDIFNKNMFASNLFVQNHWANSYEVINQANLVLDHLDLIGSNDLRAQVEGEALFLRALTYFDLVRLYGLQYESGTTNSQLGVPLRLSGITDYNNVDLSIARNSVEEVYNQIIVDLTQASSLLPESNDIYADTYAAQALLAKVYLQQGVYIDALNMANSVIQNSGHSLALTYDMAFNNDSDSQEDVFAFQVTNQDPIESLGQIGPNNLVQFYASEEFGGYFGGDIPLKEDYFNLFDDPINDDRYSFAYFVPDFGTTLTSKYTNRFANISLLRLSEMYLIRAEANFRLGSSIGASPLEDINEIRERSNATELGELTIDLILNERLLELAFEGHFIHDLRRNQRDVGDLPYNDDSLVLPIPLDEMNTNPLMVQNPGY